MHYLYNARKKKKKYPRPLLISIWKRWKTLKRLRFVHIGTRRSKHRLDRGNKTAHSFNSLTAHHLYILFPTWTSFLPNLLHPHHHRLHNHSIFLLITAGRNAKKPTQSTFLPSYYIFFEPFHRQVCFFFAFVLLFLYFSTSFSQFFCYFFFLYDSSSQFFCYFFISPPLFSLKVRERNKEFFPLL